MELVGDCIGPDVGTSLEHTPRARIMDILLYFLALLPGLLSSMFSGDVPKWGRTATGFLFKITFCDHISGTKAETSVLV